MLTKSVICTLSTIGAFAFVAGTDQLQAGENPEFDKIRGTYDQCFPDGIGDIKNSEDEALKFFFLSDVEKCDESNYVKLQNIVLNMHDEGHLVFLWSKAGIWRNSKFPLAPNVPYVQSYQLPRFDGGIDSDAPILYAPSLERSQPASVFSTVAQSPGTVSRTSTEAALLPVASSEIQTALVDESGRRRNIHLTFETQFIGDRIAYQMRKPPNSILAIGGIPKALVALANQAAQPPLALLTKMSRSGSTSEIAKLSTLIGTDMLSMMPKEFSGSEFLILWPSDERSDYVSFEVETAAAELVAVPVALLTPGREPVLTGVASMYLPAHRQDAGQAPDLDSAALVALVEFWQNRSIRTAQGTEVGTVRGLIVEGGTLSHLVVAEGEEGRGGPVALPRAALVESGGQNLLLRANFSLRPLSE